MDNNDMVKDQSESTKAKEHQCTGKCAEKSDPKFGKLCKDVVTEFTGICVGKYVDMFGGTKYVLTPRVSKDNKMTEEHWFEEGRLEVMRDAILIEQNMNHGNKNDYIGISQNAARKHRKSRTRYSAIIDSGIDEDADKYTRGLREKATVDCE